MAKVECYLPNPYEAMHSFITRPEPRIPCPARVWQSANAVFMASSSGDCSILWYFEAQLVRNMQMRTVINLVMVFALGFLDGLVGLEQSPVIFWDELPGCV